jgi:hypothetical protein
MDNTSAIVWEGSSEFIPNALYNLGVRSQFGIGGVYFFRSDDCGPGSAISVKGASQIGQHDTVPWGIYVHGPVVSHSSCTPASRTSVNVSRAALAIVSARGGLWE